MDILKLPKEEFTHECDGVRLKFYNLRAEPKQKQRELIPKSSKKIIFTVLRIFTKSTFRHRLSRNPEFPIKINHKIDLCYWDKKVLFDKERTL